MPQLTQCLSCSAEIPASSRFCLSCGQAVATASQMPTTPPGARQVSSDSIPAGGFTPGTILADRYRIIGMLGRGGMGEVYRADDLKLGQPVALKFLPRHFSGDPGLLERFHAEVRTARQVSHAHVCRVYDIGEVDGLNFISMEYVDGEDLATLLRRIGRLPPAKAVEIARQLCAGLAAAHERGVLHRDLKPANIMLDGHGRARITDFGLAVRGDEAGREIAGTPAYMSPEQLAGKPATPQSDIYALGLVLYEVFTGKKAFEATSFAEWRRKHGEEPPTHPSVHTADMDPAAERLILRCLEKDPAKRPPSVTQVALALPGGDPLAAAIAAGETPSPEMVAAAGGEGVLSLRTAWTLLGGVGLLIAAIMLMIPYSTDLGMAPSDRSPAVLRQQAREINATFGYGKDAADSAEWLSRDVAPLRHLADHMKAPDWRRKYKELGPPILYALRQSPRPLAASHVMFATGASENNPPMEVSGMTFVELDGSGRLRRFRAVPPQIEPESKPGAEFDWPPLFAAAGLDASRFKRVEPMWIPPSPFDARAEWTGSVSELPETELRVSAAAFRGKLVHFELLGPWSRPERMETRPVSIRSRITATTFAIMILGLLGAMLFFVRRNLRQGRGDKAGGFRISAFVFVVFLAQGLLASHHAGDLPSWAFQVLVPVLATSMFSGGFFWLLYVALEPYLRRRMPELLIGWARLLEGRLRDPRIGRDVLIGALFGAASAVVTHVVNGLSSWFSFPVQTPIPPVFLYVPGGINPLAYLLLGLGSATLGQAFSMMAMYFVFRIILRKAPLAVAALAVLNFLLGLGGENALLEIPGALIGAALVTILIARFGLLAMVAFSLFSFLLVQGAPSLNFSNWYAMHSLLGLLLLVAVTLYAFRISLGGQPIFGAAALED